MILIADSGSTKTTWCSVGGSTSMRSCTTRGINPFYITKDEIITLLNQEFTIDIQYIDTVYFYGAGCALPSKKQLVADALQGFFNTQNIQVESDLLGAARALCQHSEGIACILGTGSNSCYYNGSVVKHNISPLGYILGDEGSGAVLGKKLVADILKNQLPPSICADFYKTHNTTAEQIMEIVYRKAFPNRYLAQFTTFIALHIDNLLIEQLVVNSFDEFFERNILQYKDVQHLPLYFTGSIAHIFKNQLEKSANHYGLKISAIISSPIDGLVKFHTN